MNATTWLSKHEADLLARIAKETEESLMWGNRADHYRRTTLTASAHRLLNEKKITLQEGLMLAKMINSPAGDDLDFANTLIETIINKHVSNISITESQVSESRS